jgi:dihydroflavonol-4-reductase
VLVTGATGFLGRNICPYLVNLGYQVRALVRPSSDYAFLQRMGVELALGDVCDPHSTIGAVEGCQAVIHAAGKFRFWGEREEFFATNVEGTHNMLETSCQAGVQRFIYISTVAVVGKPPPGEPITEETACDPQDAYQESKLEAELLVRAYHCDKSLSAILLRPGAYYGPWGEYAFNRLFFKDPLSGLPVQVHQGQRVIFPVYIRDVAQAAELALTRGSAGETYNVSGESMTHGEINRTVEHLSGHNIRWLNAPGWGMVALARLWTWLSRFTAREPYYPIGLYPYVFYDWPVDSGKARRELGFVPTPFEQGALATLLWYHSQGILAIERVASGVPGSHRKRT